MIGLCTPVFRGKVTRFVYGSDSDDGSSLLCDLPVEIVDASGGTWRTAYDTHGNPVTRTDPLGHETRTAYDPRGLPVAITDALGKTRNLLWDAAGQPITRTDCSGRSSHYKVGPAKFTRPTTLDGHRRFFPSPFPSRAL